MGFDRLSKYFLGLSKLFSYYKGLEMTDEEYQPRNREKSKQAKYGWFWCDACDYYYGGELGKCPVCGNKMNDKKIKYDRNRSSFNA